jgi:hypothetical protein
MFPVTLLSKSLLDTLTDLCSVHPMAEHALRIDVPMLTLQKLLHLMPKWHAKEPSFPFIMRSMANLRSDAGRRPAVGWAI